MRRLTLLLLLCCLALCGCRSQDPLTEVSSEAPASGLPTASEESAARQRESATLWFRFGTEAYLAPESRVLSLSPTSPYELTLLQALVSGPAGSANGLTGVFPPGTQVLSTHREGRLLFVTLSRQILNAYADEPANWQQSAQWQTEAPLRRKLAMQSIAATVTENCDVDQVVILVDQGMQITDSMRLRESYYLLNGNDSALAAPLTRDDTLLLTPATTMSVIMDCCSARDWPQLYRYLAATDPATGSARPTEDDFIQLMEALPHLVDYTLSPGSVSSDGQRAVFTLSATLLDAGATIPVNDVIIRLVRENGLWRIGLSQLTEGAVKVP